MRFYTIVTIKRRLEQIIIFPFIIIGKIVALFKPLNKEFDFFMFFPIYGIGGAEKVNAAIMNAVKERSIVVFFTRKSPNDTLKHLFKLPNVRLIDISKFTDNKFIYFMNFIMRGVCAYYINRQYKTPVIVNGQCNFAYKLFPHLKKSTLKVEIIHTSDKKFSQIVLPYIPFIDKRIAIIEKVKSDYIRYYDNIGIPENYARRIQVIHNSVPIPEGPVAKQKASILKVYYAGRGGPQKRLHLLFDIARECIRENIAAEFHFAGSFENEIPEDIKGKIVWHGEISTSEKMYALHKEMDVLILTSAFEGFPLVIMEAMSCGVAIVSTAVDSIPDHVRDYENGVLIWETDEKSIITSGIENIKFLLQSPELRQKIAVNNHEYIKNNFSDSRFIKAYRSVLIQD